MAVNVKVEKNNGESTANLIRRFTKRMQNAGIVQKARKGRYFRRIKSRNVGRMNRLEKLGRQKTYQLMFKLGKVQERTKNRYRR